jgi:hypothetical protein
LGSATNSDRSNTAETAAGRRTETAWSDSVDRLGRFPSKSDGLLSAVPQPETAILNRHAGQATTRSRPRARQHHKTCRFCSVTYPAVHGLATRWFRRDRSGRDLRRYNGWIGGKVGRRSRCLVPACWADRHVVVAQGHRRLAKRELGVVLGMSRLNSEPCRART